MGEVSVALCLNLTVAVPIFGHRRETSAIRDTEHWGYTSRHALQTLYILSLVENAERYISANFANCQNSFYASNPPNGFQNLPSQASIVNLCLMYPNNPSPFYAALYHKMYHYPLYSAYISSGTGQRANKTFLLEPQLVSPRLSPYMMTQTDLATAIRADPIIAGDPNTLIKASQAVNSDYNGTHYDKGHLNPDAQHPPGPAKYATYTLANIVPMNLTLNRGQWRLYEDSIRNLTLNCTTMYVITGAVNGPTWISNNRVNVPSHIWSAYCCVGPNNKPISTQGVWASNNADIVNRVTIPNLQSWLNGQLRVTNINLFHNNCT
uniref:Uncharacterized protein n=1 Tax=Leptobrachium leishanense TaxID=445787 RepID=A0A8C5MPS3_9ANUR